ncbi:unnamed protein product, partial [Hapterophycus canaliculatus]
WFLLSVSLPQTRHLPQPRVLPFVLIVVVKLRDCFCSASYQKGCPARRGLSEGPSKAASNLALRSACLPCYAMSCLLPMYWCLRRFRAAVVGFRCSVPAAVVDRGSREERQRSDAGTSSYS